MRALFSLIGTGLVALFFVVEAYGQPNLQSAVDRWNDMWLPLSNYGTFGMVPDPCLPDTAPPGFQLPGGTGQEYLQIAGLWIGAIIDEQGFPIRRVSVAFDGWFDVKELYPGPNDVIVERSRRDTVNCFGEPIFTPNAIADHEYVATFEDTLRNQIWVENDPEDGPHRPLGLKITRTTYSIIEEPCNHIYWIKYRIENIGSSFLKNLYLGHYTEVTVWHNSESGYPNDDLCGFDAASQTAYWCDNDGRAAGDSSGNDFVVPNVVGLRYFPQIEWGPDSLHLIEPFVSFNWWISNADAELDYGPAWEAYCDRDSLDMGWTGQYGTPVGDQHKYDLMRNREHDYPYVYHVNEWPPPDEDPAWCTDNIPEPFNTSVRMLISAGPLGIYEYTDNAGNRIYRLNPGESFDYWVALVGGMNLHDPEHPQEDPWIQPGFFDFADLRERVETARAGECLDWALKSEVPQPVLRDFALEPIYPNPFNSDARVRFSLRTPGRVELRVYDVLGRQMQTLTSQRYDAGLHDVIWNATGHASGIYFVQARVNDKVLTTQKAVLLK